MPEFLSGENVLRLWLFGTFALLLIAGVWSGYFKARKVQPKGFKWRRFGGEVAMAGVTMLFGYWVLGKGQQWLIANQWITFQHEPAAWWVILLEYAAYFITFDTWFYWLHRWMHNEPYYKLIHKLHHWSTSPNVMTTFSVHPFESLINGGWMIIFITIYPVHDASMAFIAGTNMIMGLWVHSGYEFLPKWWNKTWFTKWFISATFHDHHHKYFTANFGGYTTVWDRLCGTVHKNFERDFVRIKERPIRVPSVDAVPAE
jgi:Delta7-sterol 5-desaturase